MLKINNVTLRKSRCSAVQHICEMRFRETGGALAPRGHEAEEMGECRYEEDAQRVIRDATSHR